MTIKKPISWRQGELLQPQHLQISDLNVRKLQFDMTQAVNNYAWGVGHIEINRDALANLVFDISSTKLIFRDGAFLEFPDNTMFKPRSFASAWQQGDKPFMVYVGIRRLSASHPNVTVVSSSQSLDNVKTRFVTEDEPNVVGDIYFDGPDAHLKQMSYVLKVFWQDELEQASEYETLAVACVEREGDSVKLSDSFIPPCFCQMGSVALTHLVKEIRDSVAARARDLEAYKSPSAVSGMGFSENQLQIAMALRSLSRYVPLLNHYSNTPNLHPWDVFGKMLEMIGEFSSFSDKVNALGETTSGENLLLPYDHHDLTTCFAHARHLLFQLLNEVALGPEQSVHLAFDGSYFSAELPKEFINTRNRYYLAVWTQADSDDCLTAILSTAKLAAYESMPYLVEHSLPGAELMHLSSPPPGLPRGNYQLFFRIESVSEEWSTIESTRRAALFWSNAPEDLKVDIVAIRR